MNKELKTTCANSDKKNYVLDVLEKRYGTRQDISLKQNHDNDFDIKLGSRNIVRIVANKGDNSNGVALFTSCKEYVKEIAKLDSIADNVKAYNIDEIGKKDSCFFRYNFETIGSALIASIDIFELVSKAIMSKKEDKSKEADKKAKEASKEADKDKSKDKSKEASKDKKADKSKDKSKTGDKSKHKEVSASTTNKSKTGAKKKA